ncbi:ubiquitin-like domain-containing protein [Robertmurraya korlensis]|uniref:G5 and 3D domain-containing protein n=1 Tax=Robertmurraya korlensis TaxID=519977 RepID=UPI00203AE121|nr:G5 and 3D domain-containing protein [Robertmurraya korlensis]MCM3603658.1 ubiquitin-like domain-containing protein [Robertmurraya korlensis]
MKNLFSRSLRTKKWAVISASFIVFTTATGFTVYETTKETVTMTLDGKERIIKTHAATIEGIFDELDIDLRSEDYVFPSENTKVKDNLKVVYKPAKQVQMVKDTEEKAVWSTADTVEEFLKEQEIILTEHDKVTPDLDTAIKKDMNIEVNIAFPFKLNNGGTEEEAWTTTSTTVADFLLQQGITLGELDRVEPEKDSVIQKDAVVSIVKVEKVTDVVEEPIHFAVVTKNDSNLSKGTEKVVTPGQEGLMTKEYEVVLENGKEVSRTLLKETQVKEKQDKVVAVGTKVSNQIVSRGSDSASKEFFVTSTAYTASCNGCSGVTATGLNLHANPGAKVIAVDPSVIPLGTKVYVEGYGYAVAADKGSAIIGNKIDVFFASKADAYRWGRKTVKIKILN